MKFTCNAKDLKKSIETIMPGVAPKPASTVLGGIHIKTRENALEMASSNINSYYTVTMPAEKTEEGETTIPADRFYNLVKALENEKIEITANKTQLKIKSKTAQFELSIIKGNFPEPPTQSKVTEASLTMTGEEFKETIKKTAYAASKDTNRPLFNGVYCEIDKNRTAFASTNTHRLAIITKENTADKKVSTNIPASVMTEIAKIIENEEELTISIAQNITTINSANWKIIVNSIEGKYPDFWRIVPKEGATTVTINRKLFAAAINRVSLCSGTENGYMCIILQVENDNMTISSMGNQDSTAKETVPCKNEGNPVTIAFNAKYLAEYCKSTNAEEIKLVMNSQLNPAAIYEKDNKDYLYIVTPVRGRY